MPSGAPLRNAVLSAMLAIIACGGPPDVAVAPCTDCLLTNANNFAYTTDLHIGSSPLRAQTDATIRWDTLTKEVRGGDLDPLRDIEEARLIAFRDLDRAAVSEALAHDELAQSDVIVFVTCQPTDASCALSDFGMFGNRVDIQQYFQEGYGTWLLALGKKGEPGADALMFLEAVAATDVTEARLTDSTSTLSVDVDLDSLRPLVVPVATPAIRIDWSGLTRDGLGDTLDHDTLDQLWVARFAEAPEALAQDVFSLDERAQVSWNLDVSGLDSATLTDLDGAGAFGGIDEGGTWLLALRCTSCTNPAPRFVTLLEGSAE